MLRASIRSALRSLSFKLGVAFALVILVVVGCMGAYTYVQDRRNAVRHEITELQILSSQLAARIDRSLAIGKGLVDHLARTRDVWQYLEHPAGPEQAACLAWLDVQARQTQGLAAIFIMSPAGRCLASSNRAFIGHDFSFRPYFQEAMAGHPAASDWMIGSVVKEPRIFSAAPVRQGGRILGVLVAEFRVDEVEQAVRGIGVHGRSAVVINAQGIALAHSDPGRQYHALMPLDAAALAALQSSHQFQERVLPADPLSPEFVEAFRRVRGTLRAQTVTYRLGSAVKWGALSPVLERAWVVSVAIPEAELLVPIHRAAANTLLAGLATTLGGFLLAFALGRSLLDPIHRLSAAMARFGAGDATARAPVLSQDERGRLAQEFNTMAAALQDQQARLEELVQVRTRDLSRSEERFRQVVDCADEWIWEVAPDGLYTYASGAVERILGYTPGDLVGRVRYYDLFAPEWRDVLQVQVREHFEERLGFRNFFNPNLHKDGHVVFLETSGMPVFDGSGRFLGFRGADRDISSRRQAELEVERLTRLLKESQAIARLGGWEVDLLADTLHWTEETFRIHGTTPGEYTPTVETSLAFYAPESAPLLREALRLAIAEGRPYELDLQLQPAGGDQAWVHTTGRPLQEQGRTVKLVGFVQDITERRRVEQEHALLQGQLLQGQKMESLGRLAGGIAHDMNNVLGAILALSSANVDVQPAGSAVHRAFETISQAASRGGKMVRGLLSFTRQHPAEERDLDLNGILLEEVRLLERTTLARVRLELDLAPGLRIIRGDGNALANAFMNLCVNAVDAMGDSGRLTLRTRNLDEAWVEVVVRDDGCGMTRALLEKALDPYFTTKEVGKGTGLGLPMVYSTVRAHRGQMEIESEPGQGTQVRMRFPAFEPAAAPADPPGAARPAQRTRTLRVLVVDDDDLVRESTEALLQAMGHEVKAVGSGEEALQELERGYLPEAVVLDINMPGLGGAGTLPRLRELAPAVPVLVASGRVDQAALELARRFPHVSLLPKPFSLGDLQAQFDALERNRQG